MPLFSLLSYRAAAAFLSILLLSSRQKRETFQLFSSLLSTAIRLLAFLSVNALCLACIARSLARLLLNGIEWVAFCCV